eukprot:359555-Chlamydomonas_euryale.AAC.9
MTLPQLRPQRLWSLSVAARGGALCGASRCAQTFTAHTCSCRSRSRVSSSRRSSSSFATSDAFFASSASSCRICALRRCVVSLIGSPAAAATPPFAAGLLCLVARFPEDLLLNGTLPLPPPPQLSERPLAHAAAAARVRRPRAPVASCWRAHSATHAATTTSSDPAAGTKTMLGRRDCPRNTAHVSCAWRSTARCAGWARSYGARC